MPEALSQLWASTEPVVYKPHIFSWITISANSWGRSVPMAQQSATAGPLCTCRLNLARRTSWGRWDEWDDTAFQTQDSKFALLRSEAEHPTSRTRRLPTILNIYECAAMFCFFETWRPEWSSNPRTPTFQTGRFNYCTRAPAIYSWESSNPQLAPICC